MSSRTIRALAWVSLCGSQSIYCLPAFAQDRSSAAEEALEEAKRAYGPPPPASQRCTAEEEAATISQEIVVCRRIVDQSEYRLRSNKDAERAYAEETMDKDNPKPPDFIRDCHEQGWPVGCVKVGSVPPPAYIIDFSTLPEAPPGSDADRIARGLPPLGNDTGVEAEPTETVSPEGSAEPEGRP